MGASCQRRVLADCWPERSDGAPRRLRGAEDAALQPRAGARARRACQGQRRAHPTKGENMSVEEILGTHRRPLIADVATLAACIDECAACAATCTICADA